MSKLYDRKRKRSRSSKRYKDYSYLEENKSYEKRKEEESYSRKRDKKYNDKQKEEEFKMPSKCSIGSIGNKNKKDTKYVVFCLIYNFD